MASINIRSGLGASVPGGGQNPFARREDERRRREAMDRRREEELHSASTTDEINRRRRRELREEADNPWTMIQDQRHREDTVDSRNANREQQRFNAINRIQRESEERRRLAIERLMAQAGGFGVDGGGGSLPIYPDLSAQEDAARRSTLARTKDTAGQIGAASMRALADAGAARGIGGSALGLSGAGGIINTGAQQIGDTNRQFMMDALNNARSRASEQLQARLTARGQNLNFRSGILNQLLGGLRY